MSLKQTMRAHFKSWVEKNQTLPRDLKDSVLKEGPLVLDYYDRMEKELFLKNIGRANKGRPPFNPKQVKELAEMHAFVFCTAVDREAKRRFESDLSKSKRERHKAELIKMDLMADGVATDEFQEAGLRIATDRE